MEGCACENGAQSSDKTAIVCRKEEVKKKGMFLPFFTFSIQSTNRSAPSLVKKYHCLQVPRVNPLKVSSC